MTCPGPSSPGAALTFYEPGNGDGRGSFTLKKRDSIFVRLRSRAPRERWEIEIKNHGVFGRVLKSFP